MLYYNICANLLGTFNFEKIGEKRVGVQGKDTEKSWTQGLEPKYSD